MDNVDSLLTSTVKLKHCLSTCLYDKNNVNWIHWLDNELLAFEHSRFVIFIPNRTFLVRFGGISDVFGRAMVRILARRSQAKIPMARPNENIR